MKSNASRLREAFFLGDQRMRQKFYYGPQDFFVEYCEISVKLSINKSDYIHLPPETGAEA